MLDFTAIDFETANGYRGSPCSVGLVKVRGGQAVDEKHWLIRPPEGVDHFDAFNVRLHGITEEMVVNAPRWHGALPFITDFVGGDTLVAHNAAFDTGVIRDACVADGIPCPDLTFACTLVLARRMLSLPSYRLPFVTEACGFEMTGHHNALADARAVVRITDRLAAMDNVDSLDALLEQQHVRLGRIQSGAYAGSVFTDHGSSRLVAAEANPDADPDGYLFGRVIVFTGALETMTRQAAWDKVTRAGGKPEPTTTKRTNVLVLGDINPASLRPGAEISNKAQRAFDLQDRGQDIELMTEVDFLQCLGGSGPDLVQTPNDLHTPQQVVHTTPAEKAEKPVPRINS